MLLFIFFTASKVVCPVFLISFETGITAPIIKARLNPRRIIDMITLFIAKSP